MIIISIIKERKIERVSGLGSLKKKKSRMWKFKKSASEKEEQKSETKL